MQGQTIHVQFTTQDYDIALSIRPEEEAAPAEIERFNSHKALVERTFKAEKAGKYLVHFDNSYSWRKGKQLRSTSTSPSPSIAI